MMQPLFIRTFDKGLSEVFPGLPTVTRVTLTLRHNAVSNVEIVVPVQAPGTGALLEDGARVTIDLNLNRHEPGSSPEWLRVFSGPVDTITTEGPLVSASYTVRASSDWQLLRTTLGWQVPGSAIGSQDGSEYYSLTDEAESVVKTVVQANMVSRLGLPVTIASDQARGSTITCAFRMHPLADVLFPSVDQAGIGISMIQGDTSTIVCDAYEPNTYPVDITEQSGAIRSWALTKQAAQVTRVVVGGSGEGTARVFRAVADTALESATGIKREVFRDARDTNVNEIMDARGQEVLAEGTPSAGVRAVLADTPALQYGRDLNVGDVVSLRLGDEIVTETLREVTLSWTPDQGFTTSSIIGSATDDPNSTMVTVLSRVMKSLRNLGRQ